MPSESFAVVTPMGVDDTKAAAAAARMRGLDGKTLCMVSNNRFRADVVLDTFARLVRERFPTAKVVRWADMPTIEAMGDVEADLSRLREAYVRHGADAVVASTGA